MNKIKKTLLTLVALFALTAGAWAQATFGVKEITADMVPADWNGDNTIVSPADLAALGITFFEVTKAQASTWADYPKEETVRLLYAYSSGFSSVDWDDGTPDGESWNFKRNQIYKANATGYRYFVTVAPAAPSGPTVDWNKTSKTGTFTMPGGNVELEPEYFAVAELAKSTDATPVALAPKAKTGIKATTDDEIVEAGKVANIGNSTTPQGTLMYFATQGFGDAVPKAPDYDSEGWSKDVPTAAKFAEGKIWVWYYIKGAEPTEGDRTDANTCSDSDIAAIDGNYVTLAAAPTYDVTFAEGTDANEWTASPATDVTKGQTVTVTYTGTKKVLGVKAEKKAAPAGPKTYTELKGGEVLQVGDILDFSDANVEYIFSSYSLSQSYGPYTVLRANITGEKPHLTVTPADDGEYYVIKDKDGDYSFRNKSLPATATSDGILITINSEDGNVRICSASVHEP